MRAATSVLRQVLSAVISALAPVPWILSFTLAGPGVAAQVRSSRGARNPS